MPQLDKMNWFIILLLLISFILIFLVIFIKRNFYSWRKVILLKNLTKFSGQKTLKNVNLVIYLTINTLFLHLRKNFFTKLQLNKTDFFSETLKSFEKSLFKK